MAEHPSKDELSGFVLGTLAPESTDSIADHIEHCAPCHDTVCELDAHKDTLLEGLRKPSAPDDAGCQNAIDKAVAVAAESAASVQSNPLSLSAPSLPGATAAAAGPTREQFLTALRASGILDADDWKQIEQKHPAVAKAATSVALAQALVECKALTKFQATLVHQNKAKSLLFGEYVVLDRLGAGGMGQVFKAKHRSMDRVVALKVLAKAAVKSPDAVKRFQREVKAAAKLIHPNIVIAHDAGQQDGIHFLVMEYVPGSDLSALVKRDGPLPIATATNYVMQAARGLAFAHAKGVVHRDIKPANLLVDGDGTVKILDMGLARLDGDVASQAAGEGLTQTGQVMGTVDYMAPEQAFDTSKADAKADVYSLGCTLYRLITGQNMFAGDTLVQKILAHREQPIPSLCSARPEVSDALNSLYQRMVAKQPEDRPTMAELVVALESLNQGEPTQAFIPGPIVVNREAKAPDRSATFTLATKPRTTTPKAGGNGAKKPPFKLVAVAATGLAFFALGIWLYIDNTRIEIPSGSTVKIEPQDANSPKVTVTVPKTKSNASLDLSGDQAGSIDRHRRAAEWTLRSGGTIRFQFEGKELRAETMADLPTEPFALTSVNLYGRTFREGELACLQGLDSLRHLDLGHTQLSDAGLQLVQYLPGLDGLWINHTRVKDVGLLSRERFPGLKQLKLQGLNITAHAADALRRQFPQCEILTELTPHSGRATGSAATTPPPPAVAPFDAAQARAHQEAWAAHLGVPVEYTNSIGMKFMLIPPGEFLMGSSEEQIQNYVASNSVETLHRHFRSEGPQHKVRLTAPIYVGVNEVSVAEFREFVKQTNYRSDAEADGQGGRIYDRQTNTMSSDKSLVWSAPGYDISDDLPVSQVTWSDAIAFCNWMASTDELSPRYEKNDEATWVLNQTRSYRLPTEAEWEFAARAGIDGQNVNPLGKKSIKEFAWTTHNSEAAPQPCGKLAANWFGLYDTVGNVSEWCHDWYSETYYAESPLVDPWGPPAGIAHTHRGAGYTAAGDTARVAYRAASFTDSNGRMASIGFRIVREIPLPSITALPIVSGNSTSATVDLLSRFKARVDANNGKWEFIDGGLVGTRTGERVGGAAVSTTLKLDYAAPESYDCETILESDEATSVVVGLAAGSARFYVALDYASKRQCYLGQVDEQRRSTSSGPRMLPGRQHRLRISVRSSGVKVFLDEEQLFDYVGPLTALTRNKHPDYETWDDAPGFFLKTYGTTRFHKFTLTPVIAAPLTTYTAPEAKATEPPPIAKVPFDAAQARAHQEAWAKYLGVPVETTNSIGMKMMLIPPGEYLMGSTSEAAEKRAAETDASYRKTSYLAEAPQHKVVITRPFYCGITEVTVGQFRQFVDAEKYRTEPEADGRGGYFRPRDDEEASWDARLIWTAPGYFTGEDFPVTQITWNDAAAFCSWLAKKEQVQSCFEKSAAGEWKLVQRAGYRLPTDAEWEHAARAGDERDWCRPFGVSKVDKIAWNEYTSNGSPQPVGRLLPNHFGLYDTIGNVWEFAHDWFSPSYYAESPESDPFGPASGINHSIRGGSYLSPNVESRVNSRRHNNQPNTRAAGTGFRVIREIPLPNRITLSSTTPQGIGAQEPPVQATPVPSPAVAPFDTAQARAHQEAWAKHLGVPVEWTNAIGMTFVLIPPGKFLMGSTEEEVAELSRLATELRLQPEDIDRISKESPQIQAVILRPVWMCQTEVTNSQFESYLSAAGITKERVDGDEPMDNENVGNRPAQISWNDAVGFCDWLGKSASNAPNGTGRFRLPTEVEWEGACRAGTTTRYSFGNSTASEQASLYAVFGSAKTRPVGERRPNPFGLFDMHGNGTEWCSDSRPGGHRALRGGSYRKNVLIAGSPYRGSSPPRYPFSFRVVAEIDVSAGIPVTPKPTEKPAEATAPPIVPSPNDNFQNEAGPTRSEQLDRPPAISKVDGSSFPIAVLGNISLKSPHSCDSGHDTRT